VLKERVNRNSADECYSSTRLPQFTPEEVAYIRGTYMISARFHFCRMVKKSPVQCYHSILIAKKKKKRKSKYKEIHVLPTNNYPDFNCL
jgi:hypothetical protein